MSNKHAKSFIEKAKALHGDKFSYKESNYTAMEVTMLITCNMHGNFHITPRSHLINTKNGGCDGCRRDASFKDFKKRANQVHNNKYKYKKSTFISISEYCDIKCPEHGWYKALAHSHLAGHGCSKCGFITISNNKKSDPKEFVKNFKKKAKKVHGDKYDYSLVKYPKKKGAKGKVKIICPEHGIFKQTYSNHITLKHNCSKCAFSKKGLRDKHFKMHGDLDYKKQIFLETAKANHGNTYDYSLVEIKKSLSDKVKIICPKHGTIKQIAHNHMRGHHCAKCRIRTVTSKPEQELRKLVKKLGYIVKTNTKKIIPPYELDLYLPELDLAIEYCGVYWHSELFASNNKHKKKLELCENQGIKLITLFENEYTDPVKKKIVISRLRSMLGASKRVIYARKCTIKHIASDKTRKFLNSNHLQGYTVSSVNYGIYYEKKLVGVCTFGKPRYNKNHEWELIRFCSKRNVNIVGGLSKVLALFKREYNPESILSYADRRWSNGDVYYKVGFELEDVTNPSYYFYQLGSGDKLFNRSKFQKHKLAKLLENYDSNLSALENLRNHKFVRIFDCGTLRFSWRKFNN